MKKLLLFSALLIFVACEKPQSPQQICEKQILDFFQKNEKEGEYQYYDIVFSELQEVNFPIDSFPTYQDNFVYWQNLLNEYIELYGDDTTQILYETWNYQSLISNLENGKSIVNSFEKNIYTSKNYTMQGSYKYIHIETNKVRSIVILYFFDKDYKLIDQKIISLKIIS